MVADETEENFLRQCYVKPETTYDELSEATELLRQRRQSDEAVPVSAKPITELPELIASYKPEKPIVVLGRVGHGKSTFLRHLRLIEAAETLHRYVQIEIDFIDRPEAANQVSDFVYDQIETQLRTSYGIDITEDKLVRAALRGELNRFRKSPTGQLYANDPVGYAREELTFIIGRQSNRHDYLTKNSRPRLRIRCFSR
jgi:hypothetical protein